MRRIRGIFDPIEDVASSVVDRVSSAVSTVTSPIGETVKDFANSTVGQTVLRAAATVATGGLATIVGPQLAAVAFAAPGVLRGESFDEAWSKEFAWRLKTTAEILGPQVANEVGDQVKDTLEKVTITTADGRNISLLDTVETAEDVAKQYGIRVDAAALVMNLTFRTNRYTAGRTFDPKTGADITEQVKRADQKAKQEAEDKSRFASSLEKDALDLAAGDYVQAMADDAAQARTRIIAASVFALGALGFFAWLTFGRKGR